MSKPSMVKDDDQVIPRSGQMMSVGSSLIPMGMTWVFSKLHASPEMVWKSLMYLVAALRFSGDLLMKSVVLSAKASALASERAYTIPWMFFDFFYLDQ